MDENENVCRHLRFPVEKSCQLWCFHSVSPNAPVCWHVLTKMLKCEWAVASFSGWIIKQKSESQSISGGLKLLKTQPSWGFLEFFFFIVVVVVVQFGCSHEHKANATGSCVILVCLPAVERVHDYYQITISAWLSEKIGVIRHLPPVN